MRPQPLAEFLEPVLETGRALFTDAPAPPLPNDPEALKLLRTAFAAHRLNVSGPMIDFDPATALSAASVLHQACWLLVSRWETETDVERLVDIREAPRSAAQHLSTDLTLRLLPQVHRRARARDPADVLTRSLAGLLRHWPLSGVLADIDDPPTTPLDFGGHPGLLMLYAERLGDREKPAWMPQGAAAEYFELVRGEFK
jgi:hypothetical protein